MTRESTTNEQDAALYSLFESLVAVDHFPLEGYIPLREYNGHLPLNEKILHSHAESLLREKKRFLKALGFYLSLSLASTQPDTPSLLKSLHHFFDMYSRGSPLNIKEQLIRHVNYVMRSTSYASLSSSSNNPLSKLHEHVNLPVKSQVLVWISALAKTQDNGMQTLALGLWERFSPEYSNHKRNLFSIRLLHQFLPNSTSSAQRILEALQHETSRISIEEEAKALVAIISACQNLSHANHNPVQLSRLTEALVARKSAKGSPEFTNKFAWLFKNLCPLDLPLAKKILALGTENGLLIADDSEGAASWLQVCEETCRVDSNQAIMLWDKADGYGVWKGVGSRDRYLELITSMAESLIPSADRADKMTLFLNILATKTLLDEKLAERISTLALDHMRTQQTSEFFEEKLHLFRHFIKPRLYIEEMLKIMDGNFARGHFENGVAIWKMLINETIDDEIKATLGAATIHLLERLTKRGVSERELNLAYTIICNKNLGKCIEEVDRCRSSYLELCLAAALALPFSSSSSLLYNFIGSYLQLGGLTKRNFNFTCQEHHLRIIPFLLQTLEYAWNPRISTPKNFINVLVHAFPNLMQLLTNQKDYEKQCLLIYWLDVNNIRLETPEPTIRQCFDAVIHYFEQTPNDIRTETTGKNALGALQPGRLLQVSLTKEYHLQTEIQLAFMFLRRKQVEKSQLWIDKAMLDDQHNKYGRDYLQWVAELSALEFHVALDWLQQRAKLFALSEDAKPYVEQINQNAWQASNKLLVEFYLSFPTLLKRYLDDQSLQNNVGNLIERLSHEPSQNMESSLRILEAYPSRMVSHWVQTFSVAFDSHEVKYAELAWSLFVENFINNKSFGFTHNELARIWVEALKHLKKLKWPYCKQLLDEALDSKSTFCTIFDLTTDTGLRSKAHRLILESCLQQSSTPDLMGRIFELRKKLDKTSELHQIDICIFHHFLQRNDIESFVAAGGILLSQLENPDFFYNRCIPLVYEIFEKGAVFRKRPDPHDVVSGQVYTMLCRLIDAADDKLYGKLNLLRLCDLIHSYSSSPFFAEIIPKIIPQLLQEIKEDSIAIQSCTANHKDKIFRIFQSMLTIVDLKSLRCISKILNNPHFCKFLGKEKTAALWMHFYSHIGSKSRNFDPKEHLGILLANYSTFKNYTEARTLWVDSYLDTLVDQLVATENFVLFSDALIPFFAALAGNDRYFKVLFVQSDYSSSDFKGIALRNIMMPGETFNLDLSDTELEPYLLPVISVMQPENEDVKFREFVSMYLSAMPLLLRKLMARQWSSERTIIGISHFTAMSMSHIHNVLKDDLRKPGKITSDFSYLLEDYTFSIKPNPGISFVLHKLYVDKLIGSILHHQQKVLHLPRIESFIHPIFYVEMEIGDMIKFEAGKSTVLLEKIRQGILTLVDRVIGFSTPFSMLHALNIFKSSQNLFFQNKYQPLLEVFSKVINQLDRFPYYSEYGVTFFEWIEGGIMHKQMVPGSPINRISRDEGEVLTKLTELLFNKVYTISRKSEPPPTDFQHTNCSLLGWCCSLLLSSLARGAFRTEAQHNQYYRLISSIFPDVVRETKALSEHYQQHQMAKIVFQALLGKDSDLYTSEQQVNLSDVAKVERRKLLQTWITEMPEAKSTGINEIVEHEFLPVLKARNIFEGRSKKILEKIEHDLKRAT